MERKNKHLCSMFTGINRQLEAFASQISPVFQHCLEQGLANERILKRILKQYLPQKYSVTSGKIMDYQGKLSNQIDIIIYDAFNFAPIYIDEDFGIIAYEAVYAIIEVKTTLDSKSLPQAINLVESLKKLRPYFSPSSPCSPALSPIKVCFSYKASKNFFDLEKLKAKQVFKHFQIICSLDSGCIVSPLSEKNMSEKNTALLFFFSKLICFLNERKLPDISMLDYYNPTPQPRSLL